MTDWELIIMVIGYIMFTLAIIILIAGGPGEL